MTTSTEELREAIRTNITFLPEFLLFNGPDAYLEIRDKQIKILVDGIMSLLTQQTLEARIDEQERTGLTKFNKESGDIVYFQEDGSTYITQKERLAQLKKGQE